MRLSCLLLVICCACSSGAVVGLAPAQESGGPRVLFDLTRTPLPEIPFPNDLATRPDPTSPTGLRVNASQIAPTHLEENTRRLLDQLDGFGTYSPITVAFSQDLDVLDFYARQNDGDPSNDGAYLVQIDTGEVFPLDVNGGHFPAVIESGGRYFMNDPQASVKNLLFPVTGPFANFLHPPDPSWATQPVDDLMTFYERSTRTLILRPVIPLRQETRYAVLLTKKLRGADGRSIDSPFASINHTLQNAELRPLLDHLPAGLHTSDLAFAWSFTTQSTTRELEAIREGLYGRGPLAALQARAPVDVTPLAARDPGVDNVFIVPSQTLMDLMADPTVGGLLVGGDPQSLQATIDSMKYVDYYVSGSFTSTNFLDDPTRAPQDATFDLDLHKGTARTSPETIYFFASVPKAIAGRKPPFPVALYGHGYTSMRLEGVLLAGGQAAKFGFGMVDIEAFGHGLDVDPLLALVVGSVMQKHGLGAFAQSIFKSRARDLDNDGVPDSGGDFWTADTFHTRDVVRQSIADWFNTVRVLRSWDGQRTMPLGGKTVLAGDFNGDGVPDLGGPEVWPSAASGHAAGEKNPGSDMFVFGSSLGGILASILPAVEPAIVAGAPVSGGSGLGDVGARSTLSPVVQAVFLEVLGPLLVNCNWSVQDNGCDGAGAKPSLVFQVQQVNHDALVPIAPAVLHPGDTVTVCNLAHDDDCRSAVADAAGHIRISLAADAPTLHVVETPQGAGLPNKVDVSVTRPGDRLRITVNGGAPIETFQYSTQFVGVKYPAGAPLTAVARGYGETRNTPDFRRLWGLSQLILEPGDPVSYAPHFFKDLLPARKGVPANVLVVATVGDKIVPVQTGVATARAAGLIELSAADPDYGIPIDQVLIRSGAVEGLDNLNRFDSPDRGPRAALGGHLRCDAFIDRDGQAQPDNCAQGIDLDPTGYACDAQGLNCKDDMGAPRLSPALRSQVTRQTSAGVSALLMPYLDPHGRHAVQPPQPSRAFDMDQFMLNVLGRYFETRGKELRFDACQSKMAECPWIPPVPK